MGLVKIDWIIILAFIVVLVAIGLGTSRRGGQSSVSFFLSRRNMPWWLLGISMVATTFSIGTPNLVTDLVRSGGVARNWLWFAFLISGMLTVFIYAKLWSRSKIMTDLEFYEIRYSGKMAAILRGFRAVYLGLFYNVFILAIVTLAFIKATAIMTNINPVIAVIVASFIILLYSTIGGLTAILWTDFYLFIFAMFGAFFPAYIIINSPRIGGMSGFLNHEALQSKLSILPDFSDPVMVITFFIIPLTIQWWAAWYPGSEPGGGGFIAQRMLSAKSEKDAVGATLFFNLIHYAVRPWPWIIVGLCSLIIFPDIASMINGYQDVPAKFIQDDIAYPIMLREFLPHGILGIVVASLIAAYMSTISTQINWGASYLVNDFHARFINKNASEANKVFVGRLYTVVLIVLSVFLALYLESALTAFQFIIMIGAGTGLIYLLRWFWWRINAWSELTAMVGAVFFSIIVLIVEKSLLTRIGQYNVSVFGFELQLAFWDALKFVFVVFCNTICWLLVTFLTKPSDEKILIEFYEKTRPGGPGWKNIAKKANIPHVEGEKDTNIAIGLACMSLGCVAIYGLIFAVGYLIYGKTGYFILSLIISIIPSVFLFRLWGKIFN